jgi:CheY-like chemotaxis protein
MARRILVVDDEASVCDSVRNVLGALPLKYTLVSLGQSPKASCPMLVTLSGIMMLVKL